MGKHVIQAGDPLSVGVLSMRHHDPGYRDEDRILQRGMIAEIDQTTGLRTIKAYGTLDRSLFWPADDPNAVNRRGFGSFGEIHIGKVRQEPGKEYVEAVKDTRLRTDDDLQDLESGTPAADLFPMRPARQRRNVASGSVDPEDRLRYAPTGAPIPGGMLAMVTAGSALDKQETLVSPLWQGVLFADHGSKDTPRYSTRVAEVENNGSIYETHIAGLHSALRVRILPTSEGDHAALAWNLAKSEGDNTGHGLIVDGAGDLRSKSVARLGATKLVNAYASARRGGPLTVGSGACQHVIGTSTTGEPLAAAHLDANALFYQVDSRDGPLDFEPGPPPQALEGTFAYRTRIRFDNAVGHSWGNRAGQGKWRLTTKIPVYEDGPSGGGGDGSPGPGPAPPPDGPAVPIPPVPKEGIGLGLKTPGPAGGGFGRAVVGTPYDFHAPSVTFRAVPYIDATAERKDPRYRRDDSGAALGRVLPAAAQLVGWGKQTAGGRLAPTENGPRRPYAAAESIAGGVMLVPGAGRLVDYASDFDRDGVTVDDVYLGIPRDKGYVGWGLPDPATGTLTSGWTITGGNDSGDLSTGSVDSSGARTERMALSSGRLLTPEEIHLGGDTVAYPMLKRSSAIVQIRTANDSAYTDIAAQDGDFYDGSDLKLKANANVGIQLASGGTLRWSSSATDATATQWASWGATASSNLRAYATAGGSYSSLTARNFYGYDSSTGDGAIYLETNQRRISLGSDISLNWEDDPDLGTGAVDTTVTRTGGGRLRIAGATPSSGGGELELDTLTRGNGTLEYWQLTSNAAYLGSAMHLRWASATATSDISSATFDVGLKRDSAGVLEVTDGSTGNATLKVADLEFATPSSGWTMTNVTTDRVLDADSVDTPELADVVGTLITDLIALGILTT